MYVSGPSSATRASPSRVSAKRPLYLLRKLAPLRSQRRSSTRKPRLCRVRSYCRPGLPRPTTSASSEPPPERRRSPTSAAGWLLGPGLAAAGVLRRCGLALGRLLALGQGLALLRGLGLDVLHRGRLEDRGENGLGVGRPLDAGRRGEVAELDRAARAQAGDVDGDGVRDVAGQRRDLDLV